jgi:dihydroorotate dehydrogenase (fumarate)
MITINIIWNKKMLSTTLCSIPLKCLGNASGCYSSTKEQLNELDTKNIFIVSKSCTITPQEGNPHPRFYIDDEVCINRMGLPNPGIDYYNLTFNNIYILSIYAHHVDELTELFTTPCSIIEVNLSCPNINNTIDYEIYLRKISELKGHRKVGIKLPPFLYPKQIAEMSCLLLKYNVDFITCCNTIPNCVVVKDGKTVIYNNLGGTSVKALSLSNVYQFYKLLGNKIDIIGCGGIKTGEDVYDYILCGATCVQIGTQLLREGPDVFQRIEKELTKIMKRNNVGTIEAFKGKIKDCSAKL